MVTREHIELLKIAIKFYRDRHSDSVETFIKNHTRRFSYFELHASTRALLKYIDFEKKLQSLFKLSKNKLMKRLENLQNSNKKIKQEKQKIKRKYEFNDFENTIIKTLELSSEIKIKLTDWVSLLNYRIIMNIEFLSRRLNISKNNLYLSFPKEIINLYNKRSKAKNLSLSKLKEREYTVIWYKNNRIKIFYGKRAKEFLKIKIEKDKKSKANKISGTPIFRGNLKGIVKIIKSIKDFSKIKDNDILVASDTTPDYMPIFNRISGIITDEGGITSHAAIVAREMKIPSIVGTKIATKVLKDGDFIELDSYNGIIKKIKK